jgi:hypothetical protein
MEGTEQDRGVNYRAIDNLFKLIEERSATHHYVVKVNMLEIYNEQLRDLLSSSQETTEKYPNFYSSNISAYYRKIGYQSSF